jgi:hypothetical protein
MDVSPSIFVYLAQDKEFLPASLLIKILPPASTGLLDFSRSKEATVKFGFTLPSAKP